MTKIGLFPLNIVVFPNSSVPLHIFEPRYKQLVGASLAASKPFGVNFVDEKRLYQTGCAVEISEVTRKYPDGRMDIIVTGKRRYTLQSLREGEEIYYVGIVEYFDDEEEETDELLEMDCRELFNEIVEVVYPNVVEDFILTESAERPISFLIAQKAGLEALRKQEVLELRSENARLALLRNYMKDILPDLREKRRIQDIITSDGYLPQKPRKSND